MNGPVLMSDGMAVGAFALGVVAWLFGEALTVGSLFAMGAGMAVVSIGWRVVPWVLRRERRPAGVFRARWRRR